MGFFSNLFDKRKKISYSQGCNFIFNFALIQDLQYTNTFQDIGEHEYRSDIIAVAAAYLDTKPHEKCVRFGSTFGKDMIRYGTVNGTILIATHPIEVNLKTIFLPKFQQKHSLYSQFVASNMGNCINPTNAQILAKEILNANNVKPEEPKIKVVATDIIALIDVLAKMVFSELKFV